MNYIKDIPENTLTVDMAKMPAIFVPEIARITVRHEFGKVVMFIEDKRVELSSITAHEIGLTVARAIPTMEVYEMIVITINNRKVELPKPFASKVSTALLRKADDADDFQLKRKVS